MFDKSKDPNVDRAKETHNLDELNRLAQKGSKEALEALDEIRDGSRNRGLSQKAGHMAGHLRSDGFRVR